MESMTTADEPGPAEDAAEADDVLMRAWQGGDERAFAVLVDRHGSRLHGFLLHLLRDAEAAEDAWSETFLRVVRARDRYQGDGHFRAWLYTVARRCAMDQGRSRRRFLRLTRRLTDEPTPAPIRAADEVATERQRQEAVSDALGRLTEEQRAALLLTYRQGLSSREVGEVLGLTGQQVRNKVAYARRLLGDMLDGVEAMQ